MKTARMPRPQASACQPVEPTDWPSSSARTESTKTETGWCSAKPRSQVGIDATGTNALLAKVSGKSQMNPADCAASTLCTSNPMTAEIHEKAKLTSRIRPTAASHASGEPDGRKPTIRPTSSITITTNKLRTTSP